MNVTEFNKFTDRLCSSLNTYSEVVGLVVLGSTADPSLRDEWSDHDFWVITKSGSQDSLVKDLSWLPDFRYLALIVCHGPHRRTVLYKSGHKVEFAVFDEAEAHQGKVERYQALIDRAQVAELMSSIKQETIEQARLVQAKPDGLENFCVLVWSAVERYRRGELLSARQYLDHFAVNQLLSLIAANGVEKIDINRDELDPRRRIEQRSPELASELLMISNHPFTDGALRLLEISRRELEEKNPKLAWNAVSLVQGLITNGG